MCACVESVACVARVHCWLLVAKLLCSSFWDGGVQVQCVCVCGYVDMFVCAS